MNSDFSIHSLPSFDMEGAGEGLSSLLFDYSFPTDIPLPSLLTNSSLPSLPLSFPSLAGIAELPSVDEPNEEAPENWWDELQGIYNTIDRLPIKAKLLGCISQALETVDKNTLRKIVSNLVKKKGGVSDLQMKTLMLITGSRAKKKLLIQAILDLIEF